VQQQHPGEGVGKVPQIWALGARAYPHRFYLKIVCSILEKEMTGGFREGPN